TRWLFALRSRRMTIRPLYVLLPAVAVAFWFAANSEHFTVVHAAPGLAEIPGVTASGCAPSGDKPWLDAKQTPACRALEVIPQMTHEEKLAFRIAVPRLGLDAKAGSDGPYGLVAGGRGGPNPLAEHTTTFPDELAVASTFDRDLAKRLGQSIGEEFNGKGLST